METKVDGWFLPREPGKAWRGTAYGDGMIESRSLAHLDRLLEAWNIHQDLRRNGAPIAELAASRARLDMIRHAG